MRTLYILIVALFTTIATYADNEVDGPDAGWDNDDDTPILGDINNDQKVNILDIAELIKLLNAGKPIDNNAANVDGSSDNVVDINDLKALQELVLHSVNATN